jgi:16S rRNA (guanine527-N7)-methyltransferase
MIEIDLGELRTGAEELGVTLDQTALERFGLFATRLYEANKTQNLTRVPSEQFVERHALESLHPLWALGEGPAGRVIDVGTGAGLPGLPIKIAYPSIQLTLLDAHGKAIAFLERLVGELGLEEVEIVNARAEEAAHLVEHREVYELAVCRALGTFPVTAELLAGFVRVGGAAVPHRTSNDAEYEQDTLERLAMTVERIASLGNLRYPVLRKHEKLDERYPRPWKRLRRLPPA